MGFLVRQLRMKHNRLGRIKMWKRFIEFLLTPKHRKHPMTASEIDIRNAPRPNQRMSWHEYRIWSLTAHPYANVPDCDEHFIQFQHCQSQHISNDLRMERQINKAFNVF